VFVVWREQSPDRHSQKQGVPACFPVPCASGSCWSWYRFHNQLFICFWMSPTFLISRAEDLSGLVFLFVFVFVFFCHGWVTFLCPDWGKWENWKANAAIQISILNLLIIFCHQQLRGFLGSRELLPMWSWLIKKLLLIFAWKNEMISLSVC